MWEPRRLTTLWASTACYRDIFTVTDKVFYHIMLYSPDFLIRSFKKPQNTLTRHWAQLICTSLVFIYFSFFGLGWDWVHLALRSLFRLLYQPRMIDDDKCGAVGGMRTGSGNRSNRRKPAPVPLCPPYIAHDLTWTRTRAAAVESQQLTAWAMARPTEMFDVRIYSQGLPQVTSTSSLTCFAGRRKKSFTQTGCLGCLAALIRPCPAWKLYAATLDSP
jgi:hypothetical protein